MLYMWRRKKKKKSKSRTEFRGVTVYRNGSNPGIVAPLLGKSWGLLLTKLSVISWSSDCDTFFSLYLTQTCVIYYPPRLVYGSDGGASIVRDLSLAGVLSDKPRFISVLGYHIWCFFDILPSETRLRVGWWFLYDQRFISVGFLAKIYLGLDFWP